MKFLSRFWYKFLNHLGSFPSPRNMQTVEIFDDLKGKGLDIGHLGDYSFKNNNVIRLNIHAGKNIDVVSDGNHYPFEDETFDKIMLRCLLEHVDDPKVILKEAARILKRKGKIVIEVPFINPIHAAPDDYFRFTPNGLKKIIQDQELIIESLFYVEDYNWAIKWILWQNLKENNAFGFKYLVKMAFLKYIINPILFKQKMPSETNFSSFGIIAIKDSNYSSSIC
tara:strand:- start:3994 stop:4665 length:672 start_codon:yes stop_codon:yes gene_type:complete